MTESIQVPSSLTLWLDGLGRFNLVVALLLPCLLLQRLIIPVCMDILAKRNQFELVLIGLSWIVCLSWELFSFWRRRNSLKAKLLYTMGLRLLKNFSGLILCLMLLVSSPGYLLCYAVGLVAMFLLLPRMEQKVFHDAPEKISHGFALRSLFTRQMLFYWLVWLILIVGLSYRGGRSDCSKVYSVQANMLALQRIVETYAVDAGKYPASLAVLHSQAIKKGFEYWRDFTNPYSLLRGYQKSYLEYSLYLRLCRPEEIYQLQLTSLLGIYLDLDLVWYAKSQCAGWVLYQYLSPKSYRIYGTDRYGRLIQKKGRDLAYQQYE